MYKLDSIQIHFSVTTTNPTISFTMFKPFFLLFKNQSTEKPHFEC